MAQIAPYMNLGSQLTVTVLLFGALGWWIDSRNGTAPLWLTILMSAGSVIGLVNMIRAMLILSKKDQQNQPGKASNH
jgi:F0F1-type ATP synthase assembly protein I